MLELDMISIGTSYSVGILYELYCVYSLFKFSCTFFASIGFECDVTLLQALGGVFRELAPGFRVHAYILGSL